MEASGPPDNDLQCKRQEDRPLSIWFHIVSLLLLLTVVVVFVSHRQTRPGTAAVRAASTLPQVGLVQFEADRATLTADGQAALDRAADAMHGNPNVRLRLDGYETTRAKLRKKDHRMDPLALERALAVEKYLEAKGIERARLTGGKLTRTSETTRTFAEDNVNRRRAELYVQ